MTRCFSRGSVRTPCRKLSRKRSISEPGAAKASFVKVMMMVLSSMAARRSTSASSPSSLSLAEAAAAF
jgi:hypothetical protein